ncbi:Uncharacterized protein T03_8367 [Trichinella britovi]|uniref:RNA-directed DNA polymerase n=1 Tax=Trichinella britovi TaxID=45882 RepID=A0A0V1DEF6_TRIBR|nr:Uncharacterized protein T03_8367 [Trichinella britovi]
MAENLHLVLNERGNCNLVHEGRVYNLKHTNMQDKLWVCRRVKKGCRGSIFTNLDVDAVLDCNPHADDCNPDNDILYKMEKKNSLKRRAAEELKTIPQIYHEEASSASADLETAETLAFIAGVKKFHEYLYGRQFTIITDHKPLLGLFVPKKETPQILSARILRWSILLNAYDYIKAYNLNYTRNYRHGKEIANADALSRLPKQSTENSGSHNPFILLLETIDISPLHSKDIARITAKDPILTRVLSWAWRRWPKYVSDERLKPYVTRQLEISIHNGCLLWGSRELHVDHTGIVRMKAFSRSYVWWPKLDSEIENLVRTCELCQQSRALPPHAPVHKWESPRILWSRMHVNLAGPICGKNYLIVVDAFSKWLEVRVLKNTTSELVISCLRHPWTSMCQISIHGLPDIIVADNGTQFTSHIFQEYLNKVGINHITSAPFHPSSNG